TLLNYQADLALAEAGKLAPVVPQYEDALAAMDQYVAHPDAVPLHRFIVLCNAAAIEFLIYGTEARADSLRARLELEDPEVQKFVSLRLEAGLSRSAEIRRMTTQNPQDLREPAMPSSDAIHH